MADFDSDNPLGTSSSREFRSSLYGSPEQQKQQQTSAVQSIESARTKRAVDVVEVSRETKPDEAAKRTQLSTELGVPYETVEAAPEEAETEARRRFNSQAFEAARVTTAFLTDPAVARVSHDSVEELSYIESLGNSLTRGWLGIKQGARQFQAEGQYDRYQDSGRTLAEIWGTIDTKDKMTAGNLGGIYETLYRYSTSRIFSTKQEDYVATQRKIGDILEESSKLGMSPAATTFKDEVEEADGFLNKLAAVAANPVGMVAFGTEVGLEFLPQLLAAGGVTAATRSPAAGAKAIGLLSGATERYRSPTEFLQAAGINMTDPNAAMSILADPELMKKAKEYGFERGVIIGAVDMFAGGVAGKTLSSNPIVDLALQTMAQGGFGGGGEALAQAKTKGIDNIDINEVIFEAVGEFATAPLDVALIGGKPLVTRAKDMVNSVKAQSVVDGLDEMGKALQASPLTERAPEVAAKHMASVLRESGMTEINIPVSAITELQNVDVQALATSLGIEGQLADATQYDGDVAISLEAFSQHILQVPEVLAQLKEHVRVDENGVTLIESQEIDAVTDAEIKEAEAESARVLEQVEAEEVSRETKPDAAPKKPLLTVESVLDEILGNAPGTTTAPAEGRTGASYFSDEALNRADMEASGNSRAATFEMSPADFLTLAEQAEVAPTKRDRVAQALDSDTKLSDIPFLTVDTLPDGSLQVTGHEGRHRMRALAARGVTSVPVTVKDSTVRWRNREGSPTVVRGESGGEVSFANLRPFTEAVNAKKQDEQVATIAEHEVGVAALFATAKDAGFTANQYASYIEAIQNMKSAVRKRIEGARLKREQKRLSQEYLDAKEGFRQEVQESLSQEPIYQALQAIGVDRLDYAQVLEIFQGNEEAMKRLPQNQGQRIYTRKGVKGLDPSMHADIYGFDGGDVMLFGMLDSPSFEAAVDAEMTRRVEVDNPTLLSLRQEIDGALEALHKPDNYGAILAFELDRLRQKKGKKRIKRSMIQGRAKAILSNYRVGRISPNQLENLQRREAKRAAKALRAGDLDKAAKHKLNQAVAFEMTRESYKALREIEKSKKALRKLQVKANQQRKHGKQRGIPIDHMEQIKAILDRFKFGAQNKHSRGLQAALDEKPVPQQEGESVKAWAKRKSEEEGIVMHIGPTVENADGTVNWQNLTLDEWRDVANTIQEIVKAGRDADKLRNQVEGYGLDQIVTEISTNLEKNVSPNTERQAKQVSEITDVPGIETVAANVVEAFNKFGINATSIILNTDSLLRKIDGFESIGTAYRFIKGGIDRAFSEGYTGGQVGYLRRMKAVSKRMNALFDAYSKTDRNTMWRERDIPGVHRRLSRREVIGVLLNMGNAENIRAMVDSKEFTEMELHAIVDSASKKDLDFAQSVWDFLDSFKPEIRETVRRRQNRNPVMVEAQALETKHGVYKGGYFPLQYDMSKGVLEKNKSAQSFDFEEARDMMLRGGFTSNHTQDGHTQSRKGSGGRPVKLDMFVLQQHTQQLIYDLEMGDAVSDAYKVLHHPEMKKAFSKIGKPQIWQALDLWLGDVITGEVHRGGFAEAALRHVRTGTTVSKLAFNFTTAALQPLGLLQTAALIGKANTLHGLYQLVGGRGQSPWAMYKFVTEQSGFMQEREQSFNKDIHDAQRGLHTGMLNRVLPGKSGDYLIDSMFLFIAKAQRFVDVVTWLGAHKQGMQMFNGDPKKAQLHADRMVARGQGSGNFHERTGFERGTLHQGLRNTEFVRTWSLFLSYFAAKMNVAYERTAKLDIRKNPMDAINYPVDMALMFMVEGTLAALIREGMDDDDENNLEELAGLAVWEGVKGFAAGLPLVRETVSAAEGFNAGGSIGGFARAVADAGVQVGQGEIDAAAIKSVNNVLGVLFKYPTSQVNKTGQAIVEGMDPWSDVHWHEYLTGIRREQ